MRWRRRTVCCVLGSSESCWLGDSFSSLLRWNGLRFTLSRVTKNSKFGWDPLSQKTNAPCMTSLCSYYMVPWRGAESLWQETHLSLWSLLCGTYPREMSHHYIAEPYNPFHNQPLSSALSTYSIPTSHAKTEKKDNKWKSCWNLNKIRSLIIVVRIS
jgi:hypothetical protein